MLFLALNNVAGHVSRKEAAELTARGADVTVLEPSMVPEFVKTAGPDGVVRIEALGSSQGAVAFALSLGLPGDQTARIAAALESAGSGRAELAKIARQWAVAENGGAPPSRLVLSGHTDGDMLWGEGPLHSGSGFRFDQLAALAAAMPKGAASVEDLMLSGCSTGFEDQMDAYASMFPRLRSAVGYVDAAPSSNQGAIPHEVRWEQVTRGEAVPKLADFQDLGKNQNIAVWTRADGYQSRHARVPVGRLRSDLARDRAAFEAAWSGRSPIRDAHSGPVRRRYETLQRLSRHPELTASEQEALKDQRGQTLRLLYYPGIAQKFAEVHAQEVTDGFRSVGLAVPSLGGASRGEALALIAAFQEKLAQTQSPPEAAVKLAPILRGLADLNPTVIPATWIGSTE